MKKLKLIPIIFIAILGISCKQKDKKVVEPTYTLLNGEYIALSDTSQYKLRVTGVSQYTSMMLTQTTDSIRADYYYNYMIKNQIITRGVTNKTSCSKNKFYSINSFKYQDNIIIEFNYIPEGLNTFKRFIKANYVR